MSSRAIIPYSNPMMVDWSVLETNETIEDLGKQMMSRIAEGNVDESVRQLARKILALAIVRKAPPVIFNPDRFYRFEKVTPSPKYRGEEIAETFISEVSFTVATDKKPMVATYGCGTGVVLGGYEAVNQIAFIAHFSRVEEVMQASELLFNGIKRLVKEPITAPIQVHLRGGLEGHSESMIGAIKRWTKLRADLPMKIASEETLDGGLSNCGKSLIIDSRTGFISTYSPQETVNHREHGNIEEMEARLGFFSIAYRPD